MNKFTILIALVIVILLFNTEEKVIIPKEAIRFRVIANSNTNEDQTLKKEVSSAIKKDFLDIALNSTKESIKKDIAKNIPKLNLIVENVLIKNNSKDKYNINYGINYFPKKEYKGVTYPAGEYESLVVTLGDGLGENFWCVLFPPLCMIDTEEYIEEVEYKSFIKESIEKYF